VVALLCHVATNDMFWYRAALYANLGGVVMAAIAALPGLIDLLGLPAYSTARETGLRHAAFNVLALLLFATSGALIYANYRNGLVLANAEPLVLSLCGLGSTAVAGWLGWTLVQTHHVGVKPTDRSVSRPEEAIDDLDELFPPPSIGGQPNETPRYHH
jgi:uncharacterized membrane protein